MMRVFAVFLLSVVCSVFGDAQNFNGDSQASNPCVEALPKTGTGAVYNTLKSFDSNDWRLLRDELAYENDWKTHEEAVHAGFEYEKDDVYFQTLRMGGVFDQHLKDDWKRQFLQKRHVQAEQKTQHRIEIKTLSPDFIRAIGAVCFTSGPWKYVLPIDNCRFSFHAGFRSYRRRGETITPRQLTVDGGVCNPWPTNTSLGPEGDSVTCTRSGHNAVTVDLLLAEVGTIHETFAPPQDIIPPEPKMVHTVTPPIVREVNLLSTRNFVVNAGNRDCPQCKNLMAASFSPGEENATITNVEWLGCSGRDNCSHWFRCPVPSGACSPAVAEFTSAVDPSKACVGAASCNLWRLTQTGNALTDTVRMTYTVAKDTCEFCEGKDLQAAHTLWEQRTRAVLAQCTQRSVANHQVQQLRTGIYAAWDKWFARH